MLFGGESKAVLELVSDHLEKKFLRNLFAALQEVESGRRKGGGKGQGKAGGQSRQVLLLLITGSACNNVLFSVYSVPWMTLILIPFRPAQKT